MEQEHICEALEKAYRALAPYSGKYRVDFDRYIMTLTLACKVPDIKTRHVLDVGTGIGIIPLALRNLGITANGLERYIFPEHGNDMFGIDDIDSLQRIWRAHDMQIYDYDIYQPDLATLLEKQDVIINDATIEHVKDPRKFFEQCNALLIPNGFLVLSTPNLTTLLKRIRFLFGRGPYWPIEIFFKDGEEFTGHWREYTLSELRYMCEHTGFHILEARNENALSKFKSMQSIKKNLRALLARIANLIPGAGEMNYILAQKK